MSETTVPQSHPRAILYRGPRSMVRRGPQDGLVTKLYRDTDLRGGLEAAELELRRGVRVHEALAPLPRVDAPRPRAIVLEDGGWGLVLEEMAGRSLLSFLTEEVRPDPSALGVALGRGLATCCRALGGPHYGAKPQDILWDGARVVLLDFEPARAERWARDPGEHSPVAASMGILLGRSLRHLSAPKRVAHRGGRRWLLEVVGRATEAAAGLEGGFARPDLDVLDVLAYRACRNGGVRSPGERTWRPPWYRLGWLGMGRSEVRSLRSRIERGRRTP